MAFPTGQWRIQGKDPWGLPPPPFLDQTKIFLDTGPHPPSPLLSKGLDDRTSPLSQGLDPALQAIHGAYPNPSTQMEAQSMDCGAVSQTDLRWLDIVFQGQYLPSLRVNYVAISKDLEKLAPQLY